MASEVAERDGIFVLRAFACCEGGEGGGPGKNTLTRSRYVLLINNL